MSKKLKILYIHQYFNTPSDSGGTRSYEIARRLVARGHEVSMLTTDRTAVGVGRNWTMSVVEGINVYKLATPYENAMSFVRRLLSFFHFAILSTFKAISFKNVDLIYATSTPLTVAIPAIIAAKFNNIPMVFEVRDLWPEMPIAVGALKNRFLIWCARRLEKLAYTNSAAVIALSPGMADGVVGTGYPRNKVFVIPNSCDNEFFAVGGGGSFRRNHAWLADLPLVSYVGTLGQLNGIGYLADLAKAMLTINPSVRFLVVGGGKEEKAVREKAQMLGVFERNFYMMSAVPKSEVPNVLDASTVCLSLFVNLQEMWKNSANKFFDALAAGKPIAVNHGGWIANLIRESGSGIVLDPLDHQKAAQTLNSFLNDHGRLLTASRAAKVLATQKFDRDKLVNELDHILLKSLINDKESINHD